jgi:hypothetical protein
MRIDIKNRPAHSRRAIGFDFIIRQPAKLRPTIRGSSLSLLLAKQLIHNIGGIIA